MAGGFRTKDGPAVNDWWNRPAVAADDADEETFEALKEGQEPPEESKIWDITRLYYKIGGYFKISFREFLDTPWPVLKQLAKLLDEHESDINKFIGYEEAAMFKNLRRMFPPNKS